VAEIPSTGCVRSSISLGWRIWGRVAEKHLLTWERGGTAIYRVAEKYLFTWGGGAIYRVVEKQFFT
jgi:hypothetical protein